MDKRLMRGRSRRRGGARGERGGSGEGAGGVRREKGGEIGWSVGEAVD